MTKYILPSTGKYSIDYPAELNPTQLDVVMAGEGPLLVIAGAGSGKTRTLTYRVSRLVESGVDPGQIMLLTFTNKAAREMLDRVGKLLQVDPRRILGGTFHHVANLLLRRHSDLVKRTPNFTILDRDDSEDLVADLVKNHRAEDARFPKPKVLIEMISFAANTGLTLPRLLSDRFTAYLEFGDDIIRAANAYQFRKEERNLVDFDDLLTMWRDLVRKHEAVREGLHRQYHHILVDEYQDTNRLQAEIVESIAGEAGNLMVVGDDAQSIYSFRGANFGNIIDFPKRFPTAKMFRLETNYRSTPEILRLANTSISHNTRQHPKELQAVRESGRKPERVICGSVIEQSQFVVNRIIELCGEGYEFKDIAVLYRAHWHSMELQLEMTRQGLPFQVRSGLRFFEQAHVKDVAGYLKIIANPKDELAWKRVLMLYPKVGAGTAGKIWGAISQRADPIAGLTDEAVVRTVPKAAKEGWNEMVRILQALAKLSADPAEMIRVVLEAGYEDYLAASYANYSARSEDLRRLADYSMRFEGVEPFLAELSLAGNASKNDSTNPEPEDSLIMSTVHQAKGLEWRAVFLISVNDGKLPDARAMRDEADGIEEERRLFYVACTRAKDLLYLVTPTLGNDRGFTGVIMQPSIFIQELNPDTYEESTVGY